MPLPFKFLVLATIAVVVSSCQQQVRQPSAAALALDTTLVSTAKFTETEYNFGEIQQGQKVKHRFTFNNTGQQPLIIKEVKPSCGCTTPEWSKEPIAPGQSGFVDLEFDSRGKEGVMHKDATIFVNSKDNQPYKVTLVGEVKVPAAPTKPS